MRQAAQKVVREDPEVRKEQILDETIRIIGERGFYGFTIQELARRCGLSNAGLLYYFGSKDLLLINALEELERRETLLVADIIKNATQRGASAKNVLDLLSAVITVGTADPELLRLAIVLKAEALDPKHPAHKTFRSRDAAVQTMFTRALTPFVDDPKKMARRVAAILDGLGEHWVRSGQSFNIGEEWDAVAERLLPELAAKKTPRRPARKK